MEPSSPRPRFTVSVGRLADHATAAGDINFRFSRRGNAVEGIRGHQRIRRRRPADYAAEVALQLLTEHAGFDLLVRGRADGIYRESGRVILEEIKTTHEPADEIPAAVQLAHWAQAKIYACLHAREEDLDEVTVQLCYLNLDDDETTLLREECSRATLDAFFDQALASYIGWVERRSEWQAIRDRTIDELEFPHASYRVGQREMAVAAYRAMSQGDQLMIEAPTGIGKTLATLFAAVKALGEGHHEQIFYLTAKTSGRAIAEQTMRLLEDKGLRCKSITLTAKDKICFTPGAPCEPEHCSFAKGYYDRLGGALADLLETFDAVTRERIETIARRHHVCPFELSLDAALWMDCVICDYNYVFDPAVYLRRFFDEVDARYCFLIDEAHNLVDRAREMFSAQLARDDVLAVRKRIRTEAAGVAKKLDAVNRAFLELRREDEDALAEDGHRVLNDLPEKLVRAVREFCRSAELILAENGATRPDEEFLSLYFTALAFARTAERYDPSYAILLKGGAGKGYRHLTLSLYCLDPSTQLQRGFSRAHGAILFSATLHPMEYYRSLLGLAAEVRTLRLASPFPAENLAVCVAQHVSTTWRNRGRSVEAIVALIRNMAASATGNFLVYFPSYRYMEEVRMRFVAAEPSVEVIAQHNAMKEEERDAFLDRFVADPTRTIVGFAVMGGVFGEGIDLTGNRLIGVMIVSVGLPQLGIEKDLIMDYFADSGAGDDSGFDFAYRFPGMTRVLQTAGRVIRSENDRGIVCLVDERYAQHRYRALMPSGWRPVFIRSPAELQRELEKFWKEGA